MPLQRRIPKRGFNNVFKKEYALVSLSQIDSMNVDVITVEALVASGLVKRGKAVKVLANGEITKAVNVRVDKISASAKSKIEAAGGSVITDSAKEA